MIGSVDNVVGFLQITRIHSGYSYAKVLTEGLQPDNGAQIKRFEQVPALFVDATENGVSWSVNSRSTCPSSSGWPSEKPVVRC